MFKPLLRTFPTLSGNVKLSCKLSELNKIDNEYTEAYVREAHLFPISKPLWQKDIKISLLNSSYEFDIAKFYKTYNNCFYKSMFSFDNLDNTAIDKTTEQKTRDEDFDFGCKRVSYQIYNNQLEFFAPFYIDNVDDLPDTFIVKIELQNKYYTTSKYLKIHITKESTHNYLGIYLKKYCNKIDSNVILCKPETNQALYYGINVKTGGFSKTHDNVFSSIYTKQNTINNTDAVITNGFSRLNLCMKQIIPISFCFDINNVLTTLEQETYKGAQATISGEYFKNGIACDFYNFDNNYDELYQDIYTLDELSGNMKWISGYSDNIMNVAYPSLRESEYINYTYKNKITPLYLRWKMLYSTDTHPYILNMSPAFSSNQNSKYRYGEFPIKYKFMTGVAELTNNNGGAYNLLLPLKEYGKAIWKKTFISEIPTNNYLNMFNNYTHTWYNMFVDFNNKDKWATVINNKAYFNGILYDLSSIYNYNTDDDGNTVVPDIEKFGIFVSPKFTVYGVDSVNTKLIYSNYAISIEGGTNISDLEANCDVRDGFLQGGNEASLSYLYLYEHADNQYKANEMAYICAFREPFMINSSVMKDNISFNTIFTYSYASGNYVNPMDYNIDMYEYNKYYNANDIYKIVNSLQTYIIYDDNIEYSFSKYNYLRNAAKNILTYTDIINGFEELPIYNIGSIVKSNVNTYHYTIFDDLLDKNNKNVMLVSNLYCLSFDSDPIKLYNADTSEGFPKFNNFTTLGDFDDFNNYETMFAYNTYFISYAALFTTMGNLYKNSLTTYNSHLSKYNQYPKLRDKYKSYLNLDKENITSYKYLIDMVSYCINNYDYIDEYNYYPIASHNSKQYNKTIFKRIDPIAGRDYCVNIPDDKIDNVVDILYIDPLNINTIIQNYIKLNIRLYKDVDVNNIRKSIEYTTTNLYAKFLNKNHVEAYFLLHNNTIKNELLSKIYVKKRNISIINSKFDIRDNFKNIITLYSEFGIDNVTYTLFIDNICYDENKQLFYFNFNKDYGFFELVFNDDFIKINATIWNLIDINEQYYKYKDLYIYRLEEEHEYTSNNYINIEALFNTEYNNKASLRTTLTPLFNNVFLEKKANTLFWAEYNVANITKIHNVSKSKYLYKTNSNTVNCMWEIPEGISYINGRKITKTYSKLNNNKISFTTSAYSYSYLNIADIVTYSYTLVSKTNSYTLPMNTYGYYYPEPYTVIQSYQYTGYTYNIQYNSQYIKNNQLYIDMFDLTNSYSYCSYIYDISYTSAKYGYYFIEVNFDNTSNSLQIVDTDQNNVKLVRYINDVDVNINPDYVNSNLKLIMPFIKSNIFNIFNYIDTFKYPKIYNIPIEYVSKRYTQSYDQYSNTYTSNIVLRDDLSKKNIMLRYFDSITPLITKTQIINNNYHLKFKTKKTTICTNEDAYPNNGNKTIYCSDDNIAKYNGQHIFNTVTNNIDYSTRYEPMEHKYYNDNMYINLEPLIEIEYKSKIKYEEIIKLENYENSLQVFKNYINNYAPYKYNNNNILFLFNKYNVKYDTQSVGLDLTLSYKLYKLIYKFILK